MKIKRLRKSLILFLIPLLFLSLGKTTAYEKERGKGVGGEGWAKIHPQVQAALGDEGYLEVLVTLKEQVDTPKVALAAQKKLQHPASASQGKKAAGIAMVAALMHQAETSQKSLTADLNRQKKIGKVLDFKGYFIVNMLWVKGERDVIQDLAKRPEVASITPNFSLNREEPSFTQISSLEFDLWDWNLETIHAPRVWDTWQIQGEGVVVGIIDSGVDWQHPALKTQWRGYNPQSPHAPTAEFNWLDVVNADAAPLPVDPQGHGTHVAGIILGMDPTANIITGVAPKARWMAVNAFNGNTALAGDLIAAGQYMLAPTDAWGVPHPEQAPHIINNSWGGIPTVEEYEWYRAMVQAWKNAGILPVFAAGNAGEGGENTVQTPGSYPESFTVAAMNQNYELAAYSGRGPGKYPGFMKPDITAPGVAINSTLPEGQYGTSSGTSMAAPHVAGTAALLLAANPALTVAEMEEAITSTALSLTDLEYPLSPNPGYGHGLVNAYDAVAAVLPGITVDRINGEDRYETAVAVSQAGWSSAATVVLARGDDFADALAGVPLAYKLNAPLLLTRPRELPGVTKAEILRLGANKAVILGGTTAVSQDIEEALMDLAMDVDRLAGKDRFATAALIATVVAPQGAATVALASGWNFPDALTVSPYAAVNGIPILLTGKDELPGEVLATVAALGAQQVLVVGGSKALSEALLQPWPQLEIIRISGATRYATAVAAHEYFQGRGQGVFIATGRDFADAATGAVLAAKLNRGLLLVQEDHIPAIVKAHITDYGLRNFTILGGTAVVSEEVATELKQGP